MLTTPLTSARSKARVGPRSTRMPLADRIVSRTAETKAAGMTTRARRLLIALYRWKNDMVEGSGSVWEFFLSQRDNQIASEEGHEPNANGNCI